METARPLINKRRLGFCVVSRRRGLKVYGSKIKVMVLGGEEGLECEPYVDRM